MWNEVIVIGAKYLYLVIVAAALIYWIVTPRTTKKYLVILGIVVCASALITSRIVAHFFYDPRPFVVRHFTPLVPHAPDNGFPSDHTLLGSAIAGTITVCNPILGIALWLITAMVGTARVLAGIHSPIDIAGSICIGAAAALVAHFLLRRLVR